MKDESKDKSNMKDESKDKSTEHRVEVGELVHAPLGPLLLGRFIDRPEPGETGNSFEVIGWVIPKAGKVECVKVLAEGHAICETALNHRRPDLAAAFPDVPDVEQYGFRTNVELDRLPKGGDLHVTAVLEGGTSVSIGVLRFRSPTADRAHGVETLPNDREPSSPDVEGKPRRRSMRRR